MANNRIKMEKKNDWAMDANICIYKTSTEGISQGCHWQSRERSDRNRQRGGALWGIMDDEAGEANLINEPYTCIHTPRGSLGDDEEGKANLMTEPYTCIHTTRGSI